MIDGVRLKLCGVRSIVDAVFADQLGFDALGFNLHPPSPRYLALRDYENLIPNLPEGRQRVAVVVEPDESRLAEIQAAGFDRFQIHFRSEVPLSNVEAWSRHVGPQRLWLAPKRAPGTPFNLQWLELAETFLVDSYAKDKFGGTGETGDWGEFQDLQASHRDHQWILAGGLAPENIELALQRSGSRFLDLNSGVEVAPGIKDHAKMKAAVLAVHNAMEKQRESSS